VRNQKAFGIFLLFCGTLVLLNVLGWSLGWLFKLIIPVAMVAIGYLWVKRGSRFWGWVLMVFGIVCLLGKLSWLIGLAFAAALIWFGISAIRGKTY
jgi:lia operon protein LiaI